MNFLLCLCSLIWWIHFTSGLPLSSLDTYRNNLELSDFGGHWTWNLPIVL